MGYNDFADLCRDVCKEAGAERPEVAQGRDGTASLSMKVGGVNATLAHVPRQLPGGVLVLVELGPIPLDRELPAMLALLDANFLMPAENTMSIGRSSAGEAVLQSTCRLGEVDGASLHARLIQMSEFAQRWQRDHFLNAAGEPAVPLAELA